MQAVVDEFRQDDIETGLVEYHEARWKKAVWNMPFNGMTVALHTQTDQLLKNNSTRQLIREQMMEVVTTAQHLGVKNLDAAFVDKMIETTDAMTPYSPSMRLDYDFHRRMEIYYLYTPSFGDSPRDRLSHAKTRDAGGRATFLRGRFHNPLIIR